ncbi:hypothetical protein A2Z22_01060 [Candidatus Woesebacteria bacterium RBG_16_34_12]|uniref:FecR protein domain-containing protein n=1 Tax=Candidatus Woesebacteria bacterium RBG_16_34_12 TaxID=1802480 RepID=A0A1F7X7Y6_9BACT|nr:MAG: hypothetical protein A2Z22_01060 [Candidatus Woesebacteria bacterium RBG_16_34_12]
MKSTLSNQDLASEQISNANQVNETVKDYPLKDKQDSTLDTKKRNLIQKLKQRKKVLALISITGFLIFFSIVILFFLKLSKPKDLANDTLQTTPTPFVIKANVSYLTGEASKIVSDRKVEIKEGDILEENDVIETEENTKLVLSFDDGSVIRVGDNTKITLSKLQSQETIIDEGYGILFARVEKDVTHKFIARTDEITVESLGTTFSLEKEEDEVKVKVFESKVVVKEEGENEVEVNTDYEWKSSSEKVNEIDKDQLVTNEFIDWSLKEEKLIVPTQTPSPKPTSQPSSQTQSYQIYLTGSAADNGISLTWTVTGINTPNGFKIARNSNGNPVYPGDDFQYISKPEARSYIWKITDGNSWHFRVCQYINEVCGVYSNDITVQAPTVTTSEKKSVETKQIVSQVNSITLTITKISDTSVKLTWSVDGTPPNGFKTIWSKGSGPVYPPRDGDWGQWLKSESREFDVGALQTGNTYYFRVCEYLNGNCGVYSNEVSQSF